MMRLKSILFVFIGIALSACASHEKAADCLNRDWYEVGRSTGAKGAGPTEPKKLTNYCDFTEASESYRLYMQGYNAGLAEYCTPENAFHMGRTNRDYSKGLCPSFLEGEFMAALERGQKVAKLEVENIQLEKKIEELNETTARAPASKSSAKKELQVLQQVHNRNKAQIRRLVN